MKILRSIKAEYARGSARPIEELNLLTTRLLWINGIPLFVWSFTWLLAEKSSPVLLWLILVFWDGPVYFWELNSGVTAL